MKKIPSQGSRAYGSRRCKQKPLAKYRTFDRTRLTGLAEFGYITYFTSQDGTYIGEISLLTDRGQHLLLPRRHREKLPSLLLPSAMQCGPWRHQWQGKLSISTSPRPVVQLAVTVRKSPCKRHHIDFSLHAIIKAAADLSRKFVGLVWKAEARRPWRVGIRGALDVTAGSY